MDLFLRRTVKKLGSLLSFVCSFLFNLVSFVFCTRWWLAVNCICICILISICISSIVWVFVCQAVTGTVWTVGLLLFVFVYPPCICICICSCVILLVFVRQALTIWTAASVAQTHRSPTVRFTIVHRNVHIKVLHISILYSYHIY